MALIMEIIFLLPLLMFYSEFLFQLHPIDTEVNFDDVIKGSCYHHLKVMDGKEERCLFVDESKVLGKMAGELCIYKIGF